MFRHGLFPGCLIPCAFPMAPLQYSSAYLKIYIKTHYFKVKVVPGSVYLQLGKKSPSPI